MTPLPVTSLILIHGAWAGAWVWDGLAPRLHDAGFDTHAVDLPGNGHDRTPAQKADLDACVARVRALIDTLSGPVGLVAHSGGGMVATQVAEAVPERITGVAYVAGMMLPSGTGFADITRAIKPQHPEASGIVPHLVWNHDRSASSVPADAARRIFFQDVEDSLARAAAARLTPQPEPARAAVPRWTIERFGRLPRLYVEALRDRSVVPAAQRRMQALVPGATVVHLDCGHAPQLSKPEQLTAALVHFFKKIGDPGPRGIPA